MFLSMFTPPVLANVTDGYALTVAAAELIFAADTA
jgi:hypothetical protein